jgi:hypothetical protein
VADLALQEAAVLHRGEQILQPVEVAAVELVPEHQRGAPLQGAITHLVKGADQHARIVELGEVELEDGHVLAQDSPGNLLDSEGLAGSRGTEDAQAQRAGGLSAGLVVAHQRLDRAQALQLAAIR